MFRPRSWRAGIPTLLVAITLPACGPRDASEPPPALISDSAGVRVVVNPQPGALGPWDRRVAATPSLRIAPTGSDAEPPLYQVAGVSRLSDGRIAIADQGAKGIRIYSRDGLWSETIGGEGQGPGEFLRPVLLGLQGSDSLFVGDVDNRRVTVVHPDFGIVRVAGMPEAAGGYPIPQGLLEDGSILVGGGFFFTSGQGNAPTTGVRRDPTRFMTLDAAGGLRADLGEFPGLEMYFEVNEQGMQARLIPFGKYPVAAAGGERVYLGSADSYEIRAYDPDGTLREIVRTLEPARTVSDADMRAYREDRLADAADAEARRTIQDELDQTPAAEHWPAYQNFVVDRAGRLWVGTFRGPSDDVPVYAVFARDGELLGTVRLPGRLRPIDIGEDYVLGVRFDELEQEAIEMYALVGAS